ncbi:MAG: hypothetical protein GXD23_15150 [Comamonadaceae bacterium]|uniref:hypothetical protein n=1 Tax=Hydrogenophaga sp. PML113 TaxID=1899350 RepID=UPI0011132126|nr:hypothetical protein [Hydrogenophaga sp. PML113]NCT98702.1 hypothetical protein [Comamonadaceae bacterium]
MTTADFRQHYTPDPHWLLGTAFGRDLLKMRLRQVEPDLNVPEWKYAAHLDPKLERMVDDLGLREVAKPRTAWETLKFMKIASSSMLAVSRGEPLPEWTFA